MCTEPRSVAAAPSCTCSTRGAPENIPYANKNFSLPKYPPAVEQGPVVPLTRPPGE